MDSIPNLAFNGKTKEAMTFYNKAFNCELEIIHYKDMPTNPDFSINEAMAERIIHSSISKGDKNLLTANDTPDMQETAVSTGASVLFYFDTMAEIEHAYAVLSEGANNALPLAEAFWAERYATFRDKFGINWMLNYYGNKQL